MADPIDKLFVEFDGSIDKAVNSINEMAKKIDESFKNLEETSKELEKSTSSLDSSIQRANKTWMDYSIQAGVALGSIVGINRAITTLQKAFDGKLKPVMDRTKSSIMGLISALSLKNKTVKAATSAAGFFAGGLGSLLLKVGGITLAIYAMKKAVDLVASAFDWATDKALTYNDRLKESQLTVLKYKDAIVDINREYQKQTFGLTEKQFIELINYERSIEYFKKSSDNLKTWWDVNSPFKSIARSIVNTTRDVSVYITDFIMAIPKTAEMLAKFQSDVITEVKNIVDTAGTSLLQPLAGDPVWDTIIKRHENETEAIKEKNDQLGLAWQYYSNLAINIAALNEKIALTDEVLGQMDDSPIGDEYLYPQLVEPIETFINLLNEQFTEAVNNAKNELNDLALPAEDFVVPTMEKIEAANKKWQNFTKVIKDTGKSAALSVGSSFGSMVGNLITGAANFRDGWKDAFEQILAAAAAMITQMIATFAILKALSFLPGGAGSFFSMIGQGMGFKMEKGGFPGSGRGLPHAEKGMMTPNIPGGIPIIAHKNEVIAPIRYFSELVSSFVTRFMMGVDTIGSMPVPAMGGSAPSININIIGGMIDDDSFWRNVINQKIAPQISEIWRTKGVR